MCLSLSYYTRKVSQVVKIFVYAFKRFRVLALPLRPLTCYLVNFEYLVLDSSSTSFVDMWLSICLVLKRVLFSLLKVLGTLDKSQQNMNVKIYFWTLL